MSKQQLPESFYLAFVAMLMHGKLQLITIGNEFDLTLVQTLTLLILSNEGELSMSNLGKLYDCDASNITGIVDGLEQKKLVSRKSHPSDRRIKMICIQPAGQKLQAKLLKRLTETSGYFLDALSASEQSRFAQMVIKISNSFPGPS